MAIPAKQMFKIRKGVKTSYRDQISRGGAPCCSLLIALPTLCSLEVCTSACHLYGGDRELWAAHIL